MVNGNDIFLCSLPLSITNNTIRQVNLKINPLIYMSLINNCLAKILVSDCEESYTILTYIDIDESITEIFVFKYLNEIIKNNPILKQTVVEKNGDYVMCDIKSFDVSKSVSIKYVKHRKFDMYTSQILNTLLTEYKFCMLVCIDKDKHKSRVYFKIHHAYVDGYSLIYMLTEPLCIKKGIDNSRVFNRKTNFLNSIYYLIIGTITLIIINIFIISKIIIFPKYNNSIKKGTSTDFIVCKSFKFDKIKEVSEKHNISVNDFLYTLMIKADNIYTKKDTILTIGSPVNVTKKKELLNFCPILNSIDNSLDNESIFKIINTTFNNYKYSGFIHILCVIMKNMRPSFYDKVINEVDYMYTNIIGPDVDKLSINITDIKFLLTAKNSAIVYNIISCKNNVNIVCSFKNGVIKNKLLFEESIYKAYDELMDTR